MSKKISYLLIVLFASISSLFSEFTANQKDMIAELETIGRTIQYNYVPKEWKKACLNWELEEELAKAKQNILNKPDISPVEFQKIVRNFFRSLKDFHVNVQFYSTETASLPIEIKEAEGKFFISYIHTPRLPYDSYPFEIGDEVIMFDEEPIAEAFEKWATVEFGKDYTLTEKELALYSFTEKTGSMGMKIPRGPIKLGVIGKEGYKGYQLIWSYTPEVFYKKRSNFIGLLDTEEKKEPLTSSKWLSPLFPLKIKKIHDKAKDILKKKIFDLSFTANKETENLHEMGAETSFVPELGKIWWKNEGYYKAYIFETEDKRLMGYLRIPHYEDFNLIGESASEMLFLPELKKILSVFEERTEGLVLDQVNNPGGSVFFLYSIASFFAKEPLMTPRHQMSLTFDDIDQADKYISVLERVNNNEEAVEVFYALFGNSFAKDQINYQTAQFMLEYFRFIRSQWNKGKTVTDPFFIFGIDEINPNPEVVYTKPILMLINHLDFSGGDFLPAILQDNKRAVLFGSPTAGAGGYVREGFIDSRFGIKGYNYTGSLAERPCGIPIENLGVVPDIEYLPTANDYKYEFEDYKQKVLEAINEAIS